MKKTNDQIRDKTKAYEQTDKQQTSLLLLLRHRGVSGADDYRHGIHSGAGCSV
jgi:hypothetical protein